MPIDATIGDATVRFKGDLSELQRDYKMAKKGTEKATSSMQKSWAGVAKKAGIVGAAITAVGVASVKAYNEAARASTQTLDQLDAIDKAASKLGVGTDFLQEVAFVADQAGVSFQTLTMAMQRYTRRAAEAAVGTGEARKAIAELGLDLNTQNGELKDSETLFIEMMDALSGVENQADRVRLAMKAFDSEGVALVNMIDSMERLRARARELGIVIDRETIRAAVSLKDQLGELQMISDAQAAPALQRFAEVQVRVQTQTNRLKAAFADLAAGMLDFFHIAKPLDKRIEDAATSIRRLEKQLRRAAKAGTDTTALQDILRRARNSLGELVAEQEKAQKRQEQLTEAQHDLTDSHAGFVLTMEEELAQTRALAKLRAGSEESYHELELQLDAYNEARRQGLEIGSEEAQRFQAQYKENQQLLEQIAELGSTQSDVADSFSELSAEMTDKLGGVWDTFDDRLADSLTDMLVDGEITFAELGRIFLREFTQRVVQSMAIDPLFNCLKTGLSALASVAGAAFQQWRNPVSSLGPTPAGPGLFDTGTYDINQALGIDVQVVNATGQPASVTPGADGNVVVMVGGAAAASVQDGGPLGSAIEQTYGLKRRGVRR